MNTGHEALAGLRSGPEWLLPMAVAGAASAGCLLLGLVDPTRTTIVPPCPFQALTGLDCPGCGTTRAMHQLLNGHAGAAIGLNLLAVMAVPVALWLWAAWAVPRVGGPALPVRSLTAMTTRRLLVVGLVLFSVLRNLPVAPFSGLGA